MATSRPLDRLFQEFQRPKNWSGYLKSWSILTIQFIILFLFFFSILNLPAYVRRLNYFYKTSVLKQTYANRTLTGIDQAIRNIRPLPIINTIEASPEPISPPLQSTASNLSNLPDNHLYIPKINVDAPILWEVDPAQIIDQLRAGVTHYQGTNLPGQNGNVVITGHSSNFWWDPGRYKQVFALLDQLKAGDPVVITYRGQPYVYTIERIQVVDPGQIEVLKPQNHSILTLITCTPVGTTLNRLVVQAKQIYPIAGSVESLPKLPDNLKTLPAVR